LPKVMVEVKAWNKDDYERKILLVSEQQTHLLDVRIKETIEGLSINPADFPEMVRFTIQVRELR
jgi:hypothetical protein